jgi:hypothetical protein
MPVPNQQMTPRPHTANAWSGARPQDLMVNSPPPFNPLSYERLVERLADLERIIQQTRRPVSIGQLQGSYAPLPPMPNIPPPIVSVPQPSTSMSSIPSVMPRSQAFADNIGPPPAPIVPLSAPAVNWSYGPYPAQLNPPPVANSIPSVPRPQIPSAQPPPPYLERDDIFRDFSHTSPQEYFVHETRLYQRINFHAKVRLGYGKAIAVLQRELENSPGYERIIRPYQIDQPENISELSPLIPNSEARLFADTIKALVDILGLQRALHALENANENDVPGIRYEIQRVIVSARGPQGPMEAEPVPEPQKQAEVGPFPRSHTNSMSSITSTIPTNYSWEAPTTGEYIPPQVLGRPTSPSDSQTARGVSPIISPATSISQGNPQRSILRRSMSGSSVMGKRVTIQDPGSYFDSSQLQGRTFDPPTRVGSPGPLSPVSTVHDMNLQLQGMDLSTEVRNSQDGNSHPAPRPPSQLPRSVLQIMSAAQM